MEASEADMQAVREKIEKLKNSKFKQQMLPAWRPVPSFGSTMIIFGVFGIIFLTLGVVLYVMSKEIQSVSKQYNDLCETPNVACPITVDIENEIKAPVYVYYQLDNFYQNHRRYVKSRSNAQLMGEYLPGEDLDDCDPIKKNEDLGDKITTSIGGKALVAGDPAYPCGLVAKSVFTDRFTSLSLKTDSETTKFDINEKGIAWESDKEFKFKNLDEPDKSDKQWLDVEDEHFIVWMRTAGLPNFRKLWGKIEKDMPAGKYDLVINNQYDVSSFDGSKYFVLSTTNVFGGTNYFLAICYIVVGALCISFGIVFFIAYMGRRSANPGQPAANH